MTEKKDVTLVVKEKLEVEENFEDKKEVNEVEKLAEAKEETSSTIKLEEIKKETPKVEEKKIVTSLEDYKLLAKNFYAGFWRRFAAYLIDIFLVSALTGLFNKVTFGTLEVGNVPVVDASLALVLVHVLYFTIMTYKYNQTLGKMILGIRVETNTGITLKLSDVFYREVVGRLLNSVILLTYLVIVFNGKKKGLHDYIADTVVVKDEYTELRRKVNESLRN